MPKQVKWNNITEHSRIQVKSPFLFFVIYFTFYYFFFFPFLFSSSPSGCGPIINDGDDAPRLLESRSTQFIFSFFCLSVLHFSREFSAVVVAEKKKKNEKRRARWVLTMANNLGAARFIPSKKNRGVSVYRK
jgi:hypothetical protein